MARPVNDQTPLLISQRRYLGNKTGVLGLIARVMQRHVPSYQSFCDVFAGTGAVGHHFNHPRVSIISNDILYSNYVCLRAFLSPEPYDATRAAGLIAHLNALPPVEDGYVTREFGGRYFNVEAAGRIDAVREEIEMLDLTGKERCLLLTSLLYAMDKIANTVGHYDAYREQKRIPGRLWLRVPETDPESNSGNVTCNMDGNELLRQTACDVLYIDPPYNSRQYCDSYHVLENITRWEKPPLEGKARKFDRSALKSRYNGRHAAAAFADLVASADCRHILFSYNNMKTRGDHRSNAAISDDAIMAILKEKGRVTVHERPYNAFTAGKSSHGDNKERVFYCRVR
ncbi:DNA adenine methylase [bacterium]|nr:DNA adenine methylase [candidate division CSSED10-310 bacterium]